MASPAEALLPNHPAGSPAKELPAGCAELHAVGLALQGAGAGERATAPEWVHLVPAGELDEKSGERIVRGRDGRRFALDTHETVLAGTELPMQFDWEHDSMFGSTRAAGWIDRLVFVSEKETDGVCSQPGWWGHVQRWTPDGRRDVEEGYFRGLSPVVRYQYREPAVEGDPAPPPLLRGLVNVALTNRPNLRMALLHSEQPPACAPKENHMLNEEKDLRKRLGLPETATAAEVAHATLEQLGALVPRADLEAAHARAARAEAELEAAARAQHADAVKTALERAATAGKIQPASLPIYERMCATPTGFAEFLELEKTLVPVVSSEPHRHAPAPPPPGAGLTAQQKRIAAELGLTEDQFREAAR